MQNIDSTMLPFFLYVSGHDSHVKIRENLSLHSVHQSHIIVFAVQILRADPYLAQLILND